MNEQYHSQQCKLSIFPGPNQSRPYHFDVGESNTAARKTLDCFLITLPNFTAAVSWLQVSHRLNINDSPAARQHRRQKSVNNHLRYVLCYMRDGLVLPYLPLAPALAPLKWCYLWRRALDITAVTTTWILIKISNGRGLAINLFPGKT